MFPLKNIARKGLIDYSDSTLRHMASQITDNSIQLWRKHQISAFLAQCEGNPPVIGPLINGQ